MLTGNEIRNQIAQGNIVISGFDEAMLNPNSYNLKLHNKLLVYNEAILDLRAIKHAETTEIEIPDDGLVLEPNRLYLGRTLEYTETHLHVPKIEGRSSVGRAGLFIHVTAGFGDIGFCGYWTLELVATQAIRIYPLLPICQISYLQPIGEITRYEGKYQNNVCVQKSGGVL